MGSRYVLAKKKNARGLVSVGGEVPSLIAVFGRQKKKSPRGAAVGSGGCFSCHVRSLYFIFLYIPSPRELDTLSLPLRCVCFLLAKSKRPSHLRSLVDAAGLQPPPIFAEGGDRQQSLMWRPSAAPTGTTVGSRCRNAAWQLAVHATEPL